MMALDQKFYRYGGRRDAREVEDDTALISRARDVISRATGQLPSVSAGWDAQSQVTLSRSWDTQGYSASSIGDRNERLEDVRRRRDDRGYDDLSYRDRDRDRDRDDRRNRSRRDRRRDRRREERKAITDKPCRTILIKHLPAEVDENYLRGILQLFGAPIQDVRLIKHKDSGEKVVGLQRVIREWLARTGL